MMLKFRKQLKAIEMKTYQKFINDFCRFVLHEEAEQLKLIENKEKALELVKEIEIKKPDTE